MYFIVSMRASSSTAAAPQHGQRQPHQMHFGHGIVEVEHRETHWGARMWGAQTTKEIMGKRNYGQWDVEQGHVVQRQQAGALRTKAKAAPQQGQRWQQMGWCAAGARGQPPRT